jgi:asparagine synthase (glutamine-hydrolysing)
MKDSLSLPGYLRELLKNVVRETDAPAILFSGGLDTVVLGYLASRRRAMAGITVVADPSALDVPYAARAAKEFGLTHMWLRTSCEDALGVLPQTIRLLKTYDPMTLRNALAPHMGLLMAKELGFKSVITGDGADELFAGYSFAVAKPSVELPAFLRRLWSVMTFSTVDIGKRMGVDVQTPFLHRLVREFAEKAPPESLVAEYKGQKHGKAVLRRAFEEEIPEPLLWRQKCPAENGSGMAKLSAYLAEKVADEEYEKQSASFLKTDGVRLRDKEHLYYYRLYRSQFGPPAGAAALKTGVRSCPDCGTAVHHPSSDFCLMCGAWPVP